MSPGTTIAVPAPSSAVPALGSTLVFETCVFRKASEEIEKYIPVIFMIVSDILLFEREDREVGEGTRRFFYLDKVVEKKLF
jgi:hypothetical protein